LEEVGIDVSLLLLVPLSVLLIVVESGGGFAFYPYGEQWRLLRSVGMIFFLFFSFKYICKPTNKIQKTTLLYST
jgi:hypothetical protein